MDKEKIKEGVRLILEGVGEDTAREGLIETPDRIARMYEEIFSGIDKDRIDVKDPDSIVRDILSKTFEAKEGQFILEKDIIFYSMCEHHLLPFYGKAHIAYILSLLTNYPYIYFCYLCVKYETVATQLHILMTSTLYLLSLIHI